MVLQKTTTALVFCCLLAMSEVHAQETSAQFKRLDRNNDGKLTKDEFSGPLFNRIDTNKDGSITAEEDIAFTQRRANARQGTEVRVADSVQVQRNIPYAGTDNARQQLDLYLPKERDAKRRLPVVVFIHGGGWQNGNKNAGYRTLAPLVENGDYAGVSIAYRLSGEAIWPAQIHDCKAAIRWLRANADKYNLDPNNIGVTGTSAGGHLVAMLGTTGDVVELEGKLGEHLDQSSRVQCVVDQYGPTELLTMGGWHNNANSPESKLVGGPIQQTQDLAQQASPIRYASKDDPPFLLIHGTKDPAVPFDQSERLHKALLASQVDSTLVAVVNGGHGGFPQEQVAKRLQQFFDKHLQGNDLQVSSEPIQQTDRQRIE